jgi:hypothetical protein
MGKRITIIQGHPDAQARHFGHALPGDLGRVYGQGLLPDSIEEARRMKGAM